MKRVSTLAGAAALLALLPLAAQAQFEGPQQPPPFPPQGPGRPGQPGQPGQPGRFPGQPPMRPMPPQGPRMSLATLPPRVLENGLGLTEDQKEKLRDIREQRPEGPPPPGQGFGGQPGFGGGPGFGPGPGPNPNAAREIKALLTDKQREMVPQLLKDVALLGSVGIPIDLVGTLKLTDEQRAKLIQIAFHARPDFSVEVQEAQESRNPEKARGAMENLRKETRQRVFGVLTADQKTAVEKWEKDHPRPEPGGPGRPGGFNGPGGPDAPPPYP